jgi:hypothetical protein
MNGIKSLFVCTLIILLGHNVILAQAKTPEASASPKQTPKVDQTPAAKATLPESANRDKPEVLSTDFCQCINRDNSASTKRIEQALAGPLHSTGLDYTDQPIQDVVTQLSDEYGIHIQVDKRALEEAGIGTDSAINVSLHNISLRSALRLTLRTVQLTWIIQDEVLMITTKEAAEKDFDTCVYNVQGLVDDSDPKSVKALVDAIYGCVQANSWAVNGGAMAEVRPLPSGLLVVSHTPAAQEEVSALLNKIRKMREKVPLTKVGPRDYEPPPSRPSANASQQQIKK